MDFCQTIEIIDCELSIYRKGYLSIRLDLTKGLIIWKDSNHWSNNFVRSITFAEIEMIKRLLPDLCTFHSDHCSCPLPAADSGISVNNLSSTLDKDNTLGGSSWQILLRSNAECWCIKGRNEQINVWRKLIRAIEKISRIPVRIQ